MWKIQSCEVCEFCIFLYYARKSVTTFSKSGNAFPRVTQKYILHILRYFATKLHNFTKFMMLFPAVLMNFPNSKVCLIGEWSIAACKPTFESPVTRCNISCNLQPNSTLNSLFAHDVINCTWAPSWLTLRSLFLAIAEHKLS